MIKSYIVKGNINLFLTGYDKADQRYNFLRDFQTIRAEPVCGEYLRLTKMPLKSHTYLLIDLHHQTEDKYRIQAKILPDKYHVI